MAIGLAAAATSGDDDAQGYVLPGIALGAALVILGAVTAMSGGGMDMKAVPLGPAIKQAVGGVKESK